MVAGEWVALRSVHVAYNFIHHTREKEKKIYCAASNLIGSSRFLLAFQAYFCFIHALHYNAEGICTFYLCLHLALGHKSAKILTYYIFLINIQRRILKVSNRSPFFCPSMYLSVCVFLCPSMYLFLCLFVCLSV